MDRPIEPADRDRRRAAHDRRRSLHDRRHFWPRFVASGAVGAVVRWFTGPWSSANGLSWMRLLILFLIVRWGLLTVYSIPSESMEPALRGDDNFFARDRVAINKLAFGPRIPFTSARLFETGAPQRWDIVVFDSPAPSDEGSVLIKRVVGLPGERIRLVNGGVLVNGKRIEPPEDIAGTLSYIEEHDSSEETIARLIIGFARGRRLPVDLPTDPRDDFNRLRRELDRLHDEMLNQDLDRLPRIVAIRLARNVDSSGWELVERWWLEKRQAAMPIQYGVHIDSPAFSVVPDGHYYCLGDNGPESFDSRMFGWVPKENLIGRAFAVVTPPGRTQDLSGFSSTPRGRLILYGSLLLFVMIELVPGFIVFSHKLRGPISALALRRGEHVLIDRLTYGLRIPFFQHRFYWWRKPCPGEIVCYRMSRTRIQDLYIGEVREVDEAGRLHVVVTGPPNDDATPRLYTLNAVDIVGIARAVWWPRRRSRRIQPVQTRVESPTAVDIN